MRHLILAVLITAVIFLGACAQPAPPPEVSLTPEEVLACLTELSSNAIQEIAPQIAELENKIAGVEEKETKLTEIKTQIDEAVAYCDEEMAQTDIRYGHYWIYTMPEENLEFYQNEYYALVTFEIQYHYCQDGPPWDSFPDIAIMDKASEVKGIPETFAEYLNAEKSAYVKEKTARLEAADKASKVLTDMLQHADSWEIREEGNEIYSVRGYGLGYTDQLTTGKWFYYMGPKTMEPKSPDSIRLKDILTAKTSA